MEGLYVRECEEIQVCEHLEDSRDQILRLATCQNVTCVKYVGS